jgi:AcrR family transcriptional regulator
LGPHVDRVARAARAVALKKQLIRSARSLFAERGYAAVSLRALAKAAGVNPAMVHYYFGDKQGLYEAVLEETITPFFATLRNLIEQTDGHEIREFLAGYMRIQPENPWIPLFLMREVVLQSSTQSHNSHTALVASYRCPASAVRRHANCSLSEGFQTFLLNQVQQL